VNKKAYLIGIDVGTTGTKSLLFSADGAVVGRDYEGYSLETPHVGYSEQNANSWWHAAVKTVRTICADPEVAGHVAAISLSLQGGTLVPVDASGEPLCPAIVWNDARAAKEAAAFKEKFGAEYMYQKSGWRLGRGLNALEILWLRENQPDIFRRAWKFLSVPDFISFKMTGRTAVDISDAGINQLADIRKAAYDQDILDFIGITEDQLAEIVPSGAPIGHLTPEAAAQLGLPESTLLVAGAHDQYAAALGAGAINAGDVIIGSGTTWVVTAMTDSPRFETHFAQSVSAVEGMWGSLVSIGYGGVCLEWFRKNVMAADAAGNLMSFEEIDKMASAKNVGANGLFFYPYFGGSSHPESDTVSKASLVGLDLSHDRFDIARAIMEGVTYQILWVLEDMSAKFPVSALKLVGGASKSALWSQMVADISGMPVMIPAIPDLTCVGAAILAGVGSGIFSSIADGYRRLAVQEKVIAPDSENAASYKKLFALYKDHARSLRALYGASNK